MPVGVRWKVMPSLLILLIFINACLITIFRIYQSRMLASLTQRPAHDLAVQCEQEGHEDEEKLKQIPRSALRQNVLLLGELVLFLHHLLVHFDGAVGHVLPSVLERFVQLPLLALGALLESIYDLREGIQQMIWLRHSRGQKMVRHCLLDSPDICGYAVQVEEGSLGECYAKGFSQRRIEEDIALGDFLQQLIVVRNHSKHIDLALQPVDLYALFQHSPFLPIADDDYFDVRVPPAEFRQDVDQQVSAPPICHAPNHHNFDGIEATGAFQPISNLPNVGHIGNPVWDHHQLLGPGIGPQDQVVPGGAGHRDDLTAGGEEYSARPVEHDLPHLLHSHQRVLGEDHPPAGHSREEYELEGEAGGSLLAVNDVYLLVVEDSAGLVEIEDKCGISVHIGVSVVDVEVVDGEAVVVPEANKALSFMGDHNNGKPLRLQPTGQLLYVDFDPSHERIVEIRHEGHLNRHSFTCVGLIKQGSNAQTKRPKIQPSTPPAYQLNTLLFQIKASPLPQPRHRLLPAGVRILTALVF